MSIECIDLNKDTHTNTEILLKDSTGDWIPTNLVDSLDPITQSVGYFMIGVKVNHGNDPYAIVLTAAHVFFDSFIKLTTNEAKFIIKNQPYIVSIRRKLFDWENCTSFAKDPISKNRLSVPEDWLFCELRKEKIAYTHPLLPLQCSRIKNMPLGTPVTIYDYPKPISDENYEYCSLNSTQSDVPALNCCIHGGNQLVQSSGTLRAKNKKLMCVTCPTSNGMSGSPIIVERYGMKIVVGLLHGGPAATFHLDALLAKRNIGVEEDFLIYLKKICKAFRRKIKVLKKKRDNVGYRLIEFYPTFKRLVRRIESKLGFDESYWRTQLSNLYETSLSIEAGFRSDLVYNIGCRYSITFRI
jgi:hypothetical protein